MPNVTPEMLALGAIWYIVFLFSTTCHEAAHALAAKWGGDPTAYHGGQVTLNPLPHILREPIGMVVAPLLTLVYYKGQWLMGWASAPYDPTWAERHPRRAAWMALAGPAANFILMLMAAGGIRLGMVLGYFHAPETIIYSRITVANTPEASFAATFLSLLFFLNLLLGTFNLLPVPPLDGHAGITLLMGERQAVAFLGMMRDRGLQLAGLMIAWYGFGYVFGPLFTTALNFLYPGMNYG